MFWILASGIMFFLVEDYTVSRLMMYFMFVYAAFADDRATKLTNMIYELQNQIRNTPYVSYNDDEEECPHCGEEL